MSLDVVKRARAKYAHLEGEERAYHIVNEVAWQLRADGAGTFYKPAGSNYKERSIDVIIYKPGGETFDILADAEGIAKPQWTPTKPTGHGDVSKWRAAVPPIIIAPPTPTPEPEPEPDPPPPARSAVTQAQFEAYQRSVDNHFAVLQGRLDALTARVVALELTPAPAYMLVGDPDAPAIGTSTTALHTHQIRAAVVPKV